MRNELVDQGKAGLEMYYQNITIDNNVIYNAHTHGITVGETIGLTIEHNTILQNPASAPDGQLVYVPSIHLADASQDVLIAYNVLPQTYNPQLTTPTDQRTLTGNFWVQTNDPHGANYVGDLFVNSLAGAHATLADLKAVPGSTIDQMNVGSSLTQPESVSDSSLQPGTAAPHYPTDKSREPRGIRPQFYRWKNPDVAAAHVDPYQHYLTYGAHEGRDPNPYFDTKYYLAHNPDVAAAGVNPLLHYDTYGWKEGRDPSAHFSTNAYLAANPDVAAAHVNPMLHYEEYGIYEERDLPHGEAHAELTNLIAHNHE